MQLNTKKKTSFIVINYFLIAILCCWQINVLAQITPINQAQEVPCYKKAQELRKQGVVLPECGKLLGVIDCNEELEYDQELDLFFKRAKDFIRREGTGQVFSGACETCFVSGLLERRINFLNGREHGTDTTYYQSGCPQAIRSHIQGVESGTWTYFYDSTNFIAWEINYYMGKKNGKVVYIKKNGDTTKLEHYKNDLLDGIKKEYYTGSKLRREISYKNGLLDGTFKSYNKNGILIEETNYKDNKKNGQQQYFYEDGVLLRTENWMNGIKIGEFKMFYHQGHIQTLETYDKKGLKEGKFEEYYPTQAPRRIAVYKKDELIEEHIFDEHGNETYTFGGKQLSASEDDELPEEQKKKKRKKQNKVNSKKWLKWQLFKKRNNNN